MPLYKVCVNKIIVDAYVIKAEDEKHAFSRVREGKAFVSDSTKLDGDGIEVIEINQEDADRWFDTNKEDSVYFELTDGVWVANIYKKEMDKDHAEKWGKNEETFKQDDS